MDDDLDAVADRVDAAAGTIVVSQSLAPEGPEMATWRWFRGADVLIPLGVLGAVVTVDALMPPRVVVSGAFALAAIVASAITTVSRTAIVAISASSVAGISVLWHPNLGGVGWLVRLVVTLSIGALAVRLASFRVRRERELRHMTTIAEAAQAALLRAMPSSIASLGFAARYVSATKEALVGGDMYEVAETPAGVRIIVGDVRGKGLDAVQMAATTLAAFRRAALTEPSLAAIATSLDDVVTAVAGDEDFVTAVLAELHEDFTVTVVNCGHHPPLLLTDADDGRLLDTDAPELPLGLNPTPNPVTRHLPEGARLLFYTDGLVKSRNREGAFFPLADSAATLRTGSVDDALDGLIRQPADHVGNEVDDDMALLLVERHPAGPGVV